MITRYEHAGVSWIDVERPTAEEVEQLTAEFELGAAVEAELLSPTPKPRVDQYAKFIYLVLHFPAVRGTHGAQQDHEVDLVIGESFVITVHYELVPAIHDFARSFEATMLLKRPHNGFHSGHIVYELAHRLYQSVEDELDAVDDSVQKIERAIFDGRERAMVAPISRTTRELLNHKRLIGNQDETLREFNAAGVSLFGADFKTCISSMNALHFRVYNRASMLMDTLSELRNTNDSLLTTRQNEIMKNLTVMATVILPLSLVASVFGMNTQNNPIIGSTYDFWAILGIMAAIGIAAVLYLQAKRWF